MIVSPKKNFEIEFQFRIPKWPRPCRRSTVMGSHFLHVSLFCKSNTALNYKALKEFSKLDSVGTLVSYLVEEKWPDKCIGIVSMATSDKLNGDSTFVEKDTPCTALHDFGQRFVMVELRDRESQRSESPQAKKSRSAFDVLMMMSRTYNCLPDHRCVDTYIDNI